MRAWGFWLLVLADWLGAILRRPRLAALHAADQHALAARSADSAAVRRLPVLSLGSCRARLRRAAGADAGAELRPAARFADSLPILGEDFVQTFIRSVLAGYAIGCGAGFLVAMIAYRYHFLKRGLLPLGNFVSALPVVGIAPIMVMWFGFDWPSKAAVVAVMCFFPMLVNTLAGLAAAGRMERDLMRSYGARTGQTLMKLNLPAAMPFIFNALKINSTLGLDRRDRRRVFRHADCTASAFASPSKWPACRSIWYGLRSLWPPWPEWRSTGSSRSPSVR